MPLRCFGEKSLPKHRVYIAVGSNIEPESHIPAALRMLREAVPIVAISTFYKTPAILSEDVADASGGFLPRSKCVPGTRGGNMAYRGRID